MADSTALDLITASLREIAVIASGEVAAAAEATDALDTLNRLLDQWRAERLTIPVITRTDWTITPNDGQYSIGPSGNVNIARPVYLDHVNYVDTSTDPDTEYPLEKQTEDDRAAVVQKALTSPIPTHWYYNPTFPLGTLELWPVPTGSTLKGVLYHPTALTEFAALSTAVSLPPAYRRAIVKNLAIELAPQYERQPSPLLFRQAEEALGILKRSNVRPVDLKFEASVLGQSVRGLYNIETDS